MRRRIKTLSVVFRPGVRIDEEIHRVEIVGLGEELRWLDNLLEINFVDLLHLLEFLYVAFDFRFFGRARGHVFARLNII